MNSEDCAYTIMGTKEILKDIRRYARETRGRRTRNIIAFTKHYEKSPVKKNRIIFESFHGKNISDSPYYMLLELLKREDAGKYEIFYSTNDKKMHQAFVDAKKLPVTLIKVDTPEYAEVLATAEFLVNNSSFPQWFIKKENQRYIQTWHGVPLKTLGKRMRLGIESMYNVQHNFLHADVLTFPNEFTREAIMRDYNLEDLYTGKVAMLGYPRNDIFHDREKEAEIRKKYKLEDKECFAYMPTWRGTSNHSLDVTGYSQEMDVILSYLDEQLKDNQMFYVNFHSMLAGKIEVGNYKHIKPFPKDADNYEFLNAMDGLVTDYSSVFFDYSITGKPVVLFTYDLEEYLHDRGLYLDITDMPFPQVKSKEELADCLVSGSYKDQNYMQSSYAEDYLAYDAENNSALALDLVLGSEPEQVELRDYSANKNKEWNYIIYEDIPNELVLDDICRKVNPETDIAVLPRNSFTESMSAFLHDNYRDDFNFIFSRPDVTMTNVEKIRHLFNPVKADAQQRVRDEKRIFAGLNAKLGDCVVASVEPGHFCMMEEVEYLDAEVEVIDGGISIDYKVPDYTIESIIVATRRQTVLSGRAVTAEEQTAGHIELQLREVLLGEVLKKKERVTVYLAGRRSDGSLVGVQPVPKNYRSTKVCDALIGTIEYSRDSFSEAELNGTRFMSANKDEDYCLNVVKNAEFGNLQFVCNYSTADIGTIWHGRVRSFKMNKNTGRITVKATLDNFGSDIKGVILRYRSNEKGEIIPLNYTDRTDARQHHLVIEFNVKELALKEIHWDLIVIIEHKGYDREIKLRCDSIRYRLGFKLWDTQVRLDNGMTVIAYQTLARDLAFTYREISPYETFSLRVKEVAALIVYYALFPYWTKKGIWLVFEKFCKMAQDNGYYFFEHCMEQEKGAKKHVYYIIDKKAKDYPVVAKYKSNVIDYMSFKHILYLLVARVYIGSDSRSHIYVWRSRPSFISGRVRKRKIFFLQHGVTAMKRVDPLFGKHGSSPMTHFTTTSINEQAIVTKYFGYSVEDAPIAGFARWDALVNKADENNPRILVMPTWRAWLDDSTEENFLASDYFRVYSSLIQSDKLAALLEKYNIKLTFYIHPKLSEHLSLFSSNNPRVELIEQGTKKLNEIMMESSMLITDYSSVAWDMLYMDKPVVYYQFDQDRYLNATGSYIDFDTELPGAVCMNEEQVIAGIEEVAVRGFKLTEEAARRSEGWYYKKDRDNSKRTYEYLKKRGY